MLKFDQQEDFETEFKRRFGVEIFHPGGVREYKLNSYKKEMLLFCLNWIAEHSTTRVVERSRRTLYRMREKVIVHQMQPTLQRLPPIFEKENAFVQMLRELQLYAVKHEDVMTAKEINKKLHSLDTKDDSDI